jgi:hypothetical protein
MQLFVLNASPRGPESSSKIMADHLVAGFLKNSGNRVTAINLTDMTEDMAPIVDTFNESDNVIIAYPLYVDSMPAFSLSFFNAMVDRCDKAKKRGIGFVMSYGFPETTHIEAVKRYNEKLTARLGGDYLGTLSRGYSNRIEQLGEGLTKPVFEILHTLGLDFGKTGVFNPDDLKKLAGRVRLPKRLQWKINLLYPFPTNRSFLVRQFWVHGTYRKRNAAPYLEGK